VAGGDLAHDHHAFAELEFLDHRRGDERVVLRADVAVLRRAEEAVSLGMEFENPFEDLDGRSRVLVAAAVVVEVFPTILLWALLVTTLLIAATSATVLTALLVAALLIAPPALATAALLVLRTIAALAALLLAASSTTAATRTAATTTTRILGVTVSLAAAISAFTVRLAAGPIPVAIGIAGLVPLSDTGGFVASRFPLFEASGRTVALFSFIRATRTTTAASPTEAAAAVAPLTAVAVTTGSAAPAARFPAFAFHGIGSAGRIAGFVPGRDVIPRGFPARRLATRRCFVETGTEIGIVVVGNRPRRRRPSAFFPSVITRPTATRTFDRFGRFPSVGGTRPGSTRRFAGSGLAAINSRIIAIGGGATAAAARSLRRGPIALRSAFVGGTTSRRTTGCFLVATGGRFSGFGSRGTRPTSRPGPRTV